MASVARTLRRIKQDLEPFLSKESILDSCKQAKHKWRQRKLGPVETIHLFLMQVLCFNTAMTHLRHLAARTEEAYVRAAVGMANDRGELAKLRRELRGRLAASPVCDGRRVAAGLEGVDRGLWEWWVKG